MNFIFIWKKNTHTVFLHYFNFSLNSFYTVNSFNWFKSFYRDIRSRCVPDNEDGWRYIVVMTTSVTPHVTHLREPLLTDVTLVRPLTCMYSQVCLKKKCAGKHLPTNRTFMAPYSSVLSMMLNKIGFWPKKY